MDAASVPSALSTRVERRPVRRAVRPGCHVRNGVVHPALPRGGVAVLDPDFDGEFDASHRQSCAVQAMTGKWPTLSINGDTTRAPMRVNRPLLPTLHLRQCDPDASMRMMQDHPDCASMNLARM